MFKEIKFVIQIKTSYQRKSFKNIREFCIFTKMVNVITQFHNITRKWEVLTMSFSKVVDVSKSIFSLTLWISIPEIFWSPSFGNLDEVRQSYRWSVLVNTLFLFIEKVRSPPYCCVVLLDPRLNP